MTIPDILKSAQEMKNLQAELKSIQEDKQSRQAQLEPLQEGVEQMLTEIDMQQRAKLNKLAWRVGNY
jgi:peptidoglycan hydrolase CwlO-like protein